MQGCAEGVQGTSPQQAAPAAAPFVRANHVCAALELGKTDLGAVKKDLAAMLTLVEGKLYIVTNDGAYILPGVDAASDEGITARGSGGFKYADLMNLRLDYLSPSTVGGYPHGVNAWNVVGLYFKNEELAKCVAQELFFVQNELRKKFVDSEFAKYQPAIDEYRAKKVKPPVPEEQRRYIVQANSWAQQKKFNMALATYKQVLEINPVSYPAAYYNMALIHSQEKRHFAAITYMKMYLLLAPEAEDARSAQDKIYEWEAAAGVR
jgi:tetratricopeptide (TPR) repeat protein